jgi:hypothetical protein
MAGKVIRFSQAKPAAEDRKQRRLADERLEAERLAEKEAENRIREIGKSASALLDGRFETKEERIAALKKLAEMRLEISKLEKKIRKWWEL